jgi:hypothetical protein
MNEQELQEKQLICGGGQHCLKLQDKEHSTQFIHLKPVNFSLFFHCLSFFLLFFHC